MRKHTVLDLIERLDPEIDNLKIVYLDVAYAFPFDAARSLELALYRTFAVPSIGGLLHHTGEFEKRPQKRYDDTDLILSEIMEHGYDSERGRAAIRRMNRQHGRYRITNEDYLYVLSTFVFEPIRWNQKFGWRLVTEKEKLAGFYFWRNVARYMNIKHVPESYEEFERFNRDYERRNFKRTHEGTSVAKVTRDMFLSWYLPGPLKRIGRPFVHALMDDPLLDAFGFPRPPGWLRSLVYGSLKLRGRIASLLPERKRPRLRTRQIKHRAYPHGYRIEDLGPPLVGDV